MNSDGCSWIRCSSRADRGRLPGRQAQAPLPVVRDQAEREVQFVPASSAVSHTPVPHRPHPRERMLHDRTHRRDQITSRILRTLTKRALPRVVLTPSSVQVG